MSEADLFKPPITAQTVDETVPLLADSNDAASVHTSPAVRRRILIIMIAMLTTISLGGHLAVAPTAAIYEQIICQHYYDGVQDPTKLDYSLRDCKIEPVQNELAFIQGWSDTFYCIPSVFLTLAYGALADRTSRRLVLLLSLIGLVLTEFAVRIICLFPSVLPLRLVWATWVFQLIGGGSAVMSSLCYAILADVYAPEERANAFFRLNAIGLLSEIVGIPLSGALMLKNPWIPFLVSLPLMSVSIIVILFLPAEKRNKKLELEQETASSQPPASSTFNLPRRMSVMVKNTSNFISNNSAAFILILPFLMQIYAHHPFVIIYASKAYDIAYSTAAFLVTSRSVVQCLLFMFIVPAVNDILSSRFSLTPLQRDVRLAQGSGILMTLGILGIGLAPNVPLFAVSLVVMACGMAFFVALRCVVTHIVAPSNLGTSYTAMGWLTNMGLLILGPSQAAMYKEGLKIGLIGLPYFCCAGAFALCTAAVLFTPLPEDVLAAGMDDGSIDGEPNS